MSWDAQGRMQGINVQGGNVDNFVYDPSNHRVWRNNQLHLRGIDGKVAALFNFNTSTETFSLATTYAWFAGRKVGQKIDRLGTVQNGSRFYPYGEESASTANDTEKFATYWRDSNSGLDYAVNRYYRASVGRFMSPDPYWGSASLSRSGSWNRYAYVEGDPVNANDPSGLLTEVQPCGTWSEELGWGEAFDVASDAPTSVYTTPSMSIWTVPTCTLDGIPVSCAQLASMRTSGAVVTPAEQAALSQSSSPTHSQVTSGISYAGGGSQSVEFPVRPLPPSGFSLALDAVQAGLSAIGQVFGAGDAFDLVNAGISTARGNYVGAVGDLAAVVPIAGNAAGAAAGGRRLGKLADDILEWVGWGARPVTGGTSNFGVRSGDNLRQIRFDLDNARPHVNIEEFAPRALYPRDRRYVNIENIHVYLEP